MNPSRPTFSVVVPLYQTEQYLPDLLDSFSRQRPGDYEIEYLFIDDGSPDRCGALAQEWLRTHDQPGEVIRQDNAGASAARNRGIAAATGEWIAFPDSDDFLSDEYFYGAARALAGRPEDIVLLSANVQRYDEATGTKSDEHPLRFKFQDQVDIADLAIYPTFIQTQAASAFFRLDIIRALELTFEVGLQVSEDAMFASTYLLGAPSQNIAPLTTSIYYYRRRAAATSAVDGYRTNPDFYIGRFERGYLPLLEKARLLGAVPKWLQNIVLYDLGWFFPREMNVERKASHLSEQERERVVELLQEVLSFIDESTIISYRITGISPETRALMLTLGGYELPPTGSVRVSKNTPGNFEISYLFQHQIPTELFRSNAREIEPIAAKIRQLDYFGQQLLFERIVRLPALPGITVSLDGKLRALQFGNYYFGSDEAQPRQIRAVKSPEVGRPMWKHVVVRAAEEVVCWTKAPIPKDGIQREASKLRAKRYRTFIRNLAATPSMRKKYLDAWLIMDKIRAGNDNGEYLYDYLTRNRPDINAWFVLVKGTPEWDRLKAKGARLIAYRSTEHKIALQLAAVVASSQLDIEIVEPVATDYYPRRIRPWRFVYLQHGVLQHNLAHWFNSKDIDLLTTASVDEHESIVADGGTYRLTADSVELTGFPRHDVVARLAARVPAEQRTIILVAPTWRNNLYLPKAEFGAARKLRAPFLETDYGRNWMGLLAHPALKQLAADHGAQIIFLPHPNLRGNLDGVVFPSHVTVMNTAPDVHDLTSRAKVTITDYSSIFFEAAIADSKVVYFQFDQEEFMHGGHTYMPGYWDYDQHGFGPVETELESAAARTVEAFSASADEWPPVYGERRRRTLPRVDGRAAERITAIIERKFRLTR